MQRLAGAPISWGVCEVPNWGLQLSVERVLGEMEELGLQATELGAAGWLPADADEINKILGGHHLRAVAAFVPLVLHDATKLDEYLAVARDAAALLQAVGASRFVTCVVSDPGDWQRPSLTEANWRNLYDGLGAVGEIAAQHRLSQVLHPHVDSLIEQADELQRVMEHTDVDVCLDTGHLEIGGADPVRFAEEHATRVGLVHLKDVNVAVADRLRSGELSLMQAVQAGVFTPLGQGDVALDRVVTTLESAGYDGWYVFEQDAALTDGEPPAGEGPIGDVRTSVQFLRTLVTGLQENNGPR